MQERASEIGALRSPTGRQPYEPPRACRVEVGLEERISGCNFTTIQVCGLTE
ncbi:MAG TPA: hypothetical protein PK089_03520 [Methanoregulaceae archaeon]|nr:hypothetical protein [Methanoregulaceae archaeon]HQJ87978.1 hypothetical protein [Methanoregulaceae archaeon]